MRLLGWVLRLVAFVVLLGFALNNQAPVTLNFLFGWQWQGPMALIVLATFALGCAVGAVGMLPAWWRQRRAAASLRAAQPAPSATGRTANADDGATGSPGAVASYHTPPVAKAGDDRPDGV
jgi:uncharacterized integral membrane protein